MHDETNPDPGSGPACGLSAHLLRTKQSLRYDHETKPESDPRVGQGVPAERPSEPLESDFPQPLRHYARSRSLHPPERLRKTARHRRQRSVRRRERASLGPLCPDAGRTGIPHRRLRPVLHRRKRRRTPLRRFARHQYRGFQRRGRLPLDAQRRGPRTDRYPRHLRIRRLRNQRGSDRHADQGDGGFHDVRHQPLHGERIFRHDGLPTHATNSAGSSTPSARKTQGRAPARWPAG